MEIKEGYYVRTKTNIHKIKSILLDNEINEKFYIYEAYGYELGFLENEIIKSSENIIDLLEIGDYVNGLPVVHNARDNGGNIVIVINGNAYNEKEIKSVVTKEQFNAVKYDVEG